MPLGRRLFAVPLHGLGPVQDLSEPLADGVQLIGLAGPLPLLPMRRGDSSRGPASGVGPRTSSSRRMDGWEGHARPRPRKASRKALERASRRQAARPADARLGHAAHDASSEGREGRHRWRSSSPSPKGSRGPSGNVGRRHRGRRLRRDARRRCRARDALGRRRSAASATGVERLAPARAECKRSSLRRPRDDGGFRKGGDAGTPLRLQ